MKTFKQYIEESYKKDLTVGLLSGAAILGGIMSGAKTAGLGRYAPAPTGEPVSQQVEVEAPQENKPKEKTPDEIAHDNFHAQLGKKFGDEYSVILNAAKRNNISENDHDKLAMLFAIRKTENGRHGRQFGVLHPRAYEKEGETHSQSLDRQAGWASSILNKRHSEWNAMKPAEQKKYTGFHHYLQSRYSPVGAENDPTGLNNNWLKNFTHHYNEHIGYKNVQ
jgi:hypothetical protein